MHRTYEHDRLNRQRAYAWVTTELSTDGKVTMCPALKHPFRFSDGLENLLNGITASIELCKHRQGSCAEILRIV